MKQFLATLFLGMALMVAALPAWAAEGQVTLTPQGDRAGVALSLPDQADQTAATLRLTFQVEGGDAGAEFLFDEGLTCPVQEYLYDESTGRLTVYLAGDKPLFRNGSLELGTIRLNAEKGAAATVRVVEDSLELVNAAYGKSQTTASGGEVTVTVAGTGATPQPGQDSGSDSGSGTGSGSGGSQPSGSQTGSTQESGATVSGAESPAVTLQPVAGSQGTTGKPGTTAAPTQPPEDSGEPAGETTAPPRQEPQSTAAPEEPQTAPAEGSGPSPLLLLGVGAAVILAGGLAVYFRSSPGAHGKKGRRPY